MEYFRIDTAEVGDVVERNVTTASMQAQGPGDSTAVERYEVLAQIPGTWATRMTLVRDLSSGKERRIPGNAIVRKGSR